jgi:hypothetical protein
VEGFNLLLSRVEDNSVQLQNLNKNRNERNDKFQNRFPPRYSNNVRPNFRNDFNLQYNANQGNNRNYNPNSYQSNGFNQNLRSNNFRNHPNNYATQQYFHSNNRDMNTTNVKSYYNQGNNRRVSFDTPQQISNSRSHLGEAKCHGCGKTGHFVRFCPNTRPPQNVSNDRKSNLVFVNMTYSLDENIEQNNNLLFLKVKANEIDVISLVDTGSEVSIIDYRLSLRLACDIFPYDGPQLKAVNGSSVRALGRTFIDVRVPEKLCNRKICPIVVKNFDFDLLLGNDFNKNAGLVIDCSKNIKKFNSKNSIASHNMFQNFPTDITEINNENLHINGNICLPPKQIAYVKVSVSNKRFNRRFVGVAYTNPKVFEQRGIYIKETEINFERGTAVVPIFHCSSDTIYLKSGGLVGNVYKGTRKMNKITNSYFNFDYEPQMINNLTKSNDTLEASNEFEYTHYKGCTVIPNDPKNIMREQLYEHKIDIDEKLDSFQRHEVENLILEFSECFAFNPKNIGDCNVIEHAINTGSHGPVNQVPYRYSFAQRKIINEQIEEWLQMGIIKPICSEWSSPVVLVKKKTIDPKTGTYEQRLCIDMRKVNEITLGDVYPLPRVQDALDCLANARFFTSLDLNSGYLQIKVKESDIKKTTFVTQDGVYAFTRMPFGLKCAPATFQRCMDIVLSGLKWNTCLTYLDDILVFSKDFSTHIVNLKEVLLRIKNSGLTIKPSKCSFCKSSVSFFGHIVDESGLRMDPKRVKSIIQFPIPQNLRDVRSFLGLAGYHRQFVNHWSDMAEPLTRLTRKNIPFYWSDEQNDAFNKIKAAISQEPVLIHYNPELETILKSDASGYAVGAKLEQKLNGKFHPVTHASRMMTKTEKTNYCISEKECLAIVYATNKFRHYLIGLKFVVITDHLPLKWLASKQNLSARLIQWALHLSQFDYTVEYKSGRLHKDVDALSRYPVDSPESEIDNMERYSYALSSEQISNDDILNLKELQKNDENFKSIYKIIDEDIDTPDNKIKSDYTINDGILYKLQKVNDKEKLVVCLPKKLWFDVLYTYHDDIYSGHLGFERTLDKIRSRFYFPDMRNFIEIYCQSCEDCSTGKVPTTPKAGLMMPICTEGPGEIIALDFLGPIPISDMGNKWIIVGTDAFTKYAEVRAFPTDKQEDVVKFYVENIVCRFGVPKVLLSDRGSQFRSQLSKAIFQLMGSSPVNTTAYHPQTNGVTERFNKTLALMLKMYCNKSQSIWCRGLPHVVFAYNTSKHSTTGYSPYYLTFNREPVLPADRNLKVISTGYPSVDDYVFELSSTMKLVREITKNRIKNAELYNKSVYDKKHRHVEYKPNDLVWIYYPKRKIGKAEKLLHYFHGPFKVIEKTSAVNYNVQNTKGK